AGAREDDPGPCLCLPEGHQAVAAYGPGRPQNPNPPPAPRSAPRPPPAAHRELVERPLASRRAPTGPACARALRRNPLHRCAYHFGTEQQLRTRVGSAGLPPNAHLTVYDHREEG